MSMLDLVGAYDLVGWGYGNQPNVPQYVGQGDEEVEIEEADYEVVGYELDEVGRRVPLLQRIFRPKRAGMQGRPLLQRIVAPRRAQAMAARPLRGQPIVERLPNTPQVEISSPSTPRRFGFGLSPATIAAGATGFLRGRCEEPIRIETLKLSSIEGLDLFDILDVKIGNKSQITNDEPMPAELFAKDSTNTVFMGNTLNPGQSAVIFVQNVSAATTGTIRGGFMGLSLQ